MALCASGTATSPPTAGRLKIWGVNTCFGANFPAHEDAEKVAAHLAKLGVNGVRMHHHDTAAAPRGIWGPVVDGQRTLDPQQLDLQDYFLDQLHRRGIYANLNLHVGRTFTEEEGFVSKDLPYAVRYNKYLLYFEPRMRERFKQFCREYLTHDNPYRKLKRTDDPGIAMVEITNENSFSKLGPGIAAGLPEPYRGEFQRQWNRWLAGRYRDSEALKKAWGGRNEPLGATLADTSDWKENLGLWRLRQNAEHPVRAQFNQPGPQPGVAALKLDVSTKAPETSSQELQFPNLTLQPGQIYTLSFWVKADATRTLHADVSNQGPPDVEQRGLSRSAARSDRNGSKSTACSAPATRFRARRGSVSNSAAATWISALAGVSLRRGGQWIVVPESQSLEAGNVDIPVAGWSEIALDDARQFMVETEKAFIRDITDFLKKDLGVRVPITASQITYHSAEIVAETCDYADIHAYWQHPRFPRKPWDPVDWTIANTPMESVAGRRRAAQPHALAAAGPPVHDLGVEHPRPARLRRQRGAFCGAGRRVAGLGRGILLPVPERRGRLVQRQSAALLLVQRPAGQAGAVHGLREPLSARRSGSAPANGGQHRP